jgi:pyruvate,water dikinase
VGGKGANLGELRRAGLPVPPAFCVTTHAYRRHLEDHALFAPIREALASVDYEDPAGIERSALAIRERILAAPVSEAVQTGIRAAYARLPATRSEAPLVSVRSSATAEDLPGASFAGQHDTYLNVLGAEAVVEHVRRCWASGWTARAIAYRERQGFRDEPVWIAVVVQQMFPSEVAGVLFTANPITSNPDELLLNSSWGLGEAVVAGRVDPDHHRVEKRTLAIREKDIRDKRLMVVRGNEGSGSREVAVPEELRRRETLADERVRELCEIGRRIEALFGFPQDVEWGFAQGRFAILQSREITGADLDFAEGMEAWQTPVARAELTSERWTWSRAYSDELQTGPSTPLMYTFAQPHRIKTRLLALEYAGFTEFAGHPAERWADLPYFRWYGARAYYNTYFEKEWMRIFIPPFARDDVALLPFPEEEREEIRKMPFDWLRFLRMLVTIEIRHPTRSLLGSTHTLYENFERWVEHANAVWEATDIESAGSVGELFLTLLRGREGNELDENVALPFNFYLYVLPHALRRLCALWCGDEDGRICAALVSGLETPTSKQNAAVWQLSRQVKSSPALTRLVLEETPGRILAALPESEDGRRFQSELAHFLAAWGHRGAKERDPFHFRWAQKPERVFLSLKPLLPLDDQDDPARLEQRLRERMLETKEECLRKLRRQPLGSLKAAFFGWFVELVQDYCYYRDWERFQNDRDGLHFRPLLEKVGRLLAERGLLADPEDLFFLGIQEVMLADAGHLGAKEIAVRVRARRRVYERYTNREPPKYLRGWEASDDGPLDEGDGSLRGTSASPGTTTGRARVCRSLDEIGRIEKHDILVTVATDPAWTTVFSIVSGIVIETGGVVSHAVMISREYGIPCVANLARACDRIPDGATITVDGTTGRVRIHAAE